MNKLLFIIVFCLIGVSVIVGSLFYLNTSALNSNVGTYNYNYNNNSNHFNTTGSNNLITNDVNEGDSRFRLPINSTITLTIDGQNADHNNIGSNASLPPILPMSVVQRVVLANGSNSYRVEMLEPDHNYTDSIPTFFFYVTDETGKKNMLDNKTQPPAFLDSLVGVKAICSTGNGSYINEQGDFSYPAFVPITKARDSNVILIHYPLASLKPVSNNSHSINGSASYYHLKFLSYYKTQIELPPNAFVIANIHYTCHNYSASQIQMFFYDLIFGLKQ
jgi:hypothetical protein